MDLSRKTWVLLGALVAGGYMMCKFFFAAVQSGMVGG